MIFPYLNPVSLLHYFLKREADQFFASIAIRSFSLGMITIFVPIYLYYFFNSIPLTLLFFAAICGLNAILFPLGGEFMERVGVRRAMMISHPFYWGYYLCLLFLSQSIWLIPAAVLLCSLGSICFWPAFHTDFARFTERKEIGKEVGRLNFVSVLPGILAPAIGGAIVASYGYSTLFITVLCLLFASAIPLFLSKDIHQIYTDSYLKAYQRLKKPENKYHNLAFAANAMEGIINGYLWPLFLVVISVGYISIGSIATVASFAAILFTLYVGRITDRMPKIRLLTIGSLLTFGAWIGKFFVVNPVSAFLAHSFYRLSRTSATIPFQAIVYQKAKDKGPEVDEFIVYRDIVINLSRFFLLLFLACLFLIFPVVLKINYVFILAAFLSLGFVFLKGIPEWRELRLNWKEH